MSYRMKMILPVVGMLILFVCAAAALVREAQGAEGVPLPPAGVAAAAGVRAFDGGSFEASGVAHVPGTDGVLFVDDGRPDEVFWMRLGEGGGQAGAIKPVRLGANVVDLEGMTYDGTHFYVVGSLSKAKAGDLAGLVRFRFDARSERVGGVEAVSGLKRFLADNVEELRGMAETKYRDGGINIEGVAWDPRGRRLLLGVRSPVVDGHALVVPLRLRDPRGALSAANLEVEGSKAIRLPLGGAGVRSIEYDERLGAFRVITGAGPNAEKLDFKLWEWDGDAVSPVLRETGSYDRRLKPEGVTRVSSNGRDFTFIVFDTSWYAATE
ncbi:MAG TPA: DUF3616 domain-containing protein [Pyrinomonadaceae bacterium]|nr:DUF3616 domain-containing protein [Pyrinomonadaceae bacterium]